MRKRILVYPCGTEIGLEIYRSLCYSSHYEVWGGSSSYDHGRFVYENHIDGLPFITDNSPVEEIAAFNDMIAAYGFSAIYPAMDGVVTVFAKYREYLSPVVIAPDITVAAITRSKRATYAALEKVIPVPKIYKNSYEIESFPCFKKPDVGQGSVGTKKITTPGQLDDVNFRDNNTLVTEYLPGEEYTVDCFTNNQGEVIYARARGRRRIKGGISVNAVFVDKPELLEYAQKINEILPHLGGWFFQIKEDGAGSFKLMEVASRVAGASAITRAAGVNLPLLTVNAFMGINTDAVIVAKHNIELDRALENKYAVDLDFGAVYTDYDDTMVVDGKINLLMMEFLYQCVNEGKKIILLTRHTGTSIEKELKDHRMTDLFDEVIQLFKSDNKADRIDMELNPIFIDDSYGERKAVSDALGIPVFDTHGVESLIR